MRWLFIKESLGWPRTRGNDIHTYYLMQALAHAGHQIGLLTVAPPLPQAVDGINGIQQFAVSESFTNTKSSDLSLSRLERKFVNYWGVDPALLAATQSLAPEYDVVVAASIATLPCLKMVGVKRVWYPADDPVTSALSICQFRHRSDLILLCTALTQAVYMRVFRKYVDVAWVVSTKDAKGLRKYGGIPQPALLPNGVDNEYFQPLSMEQRPFSCVFWGRLDFKPNQDAIIWFCTHIWPRLIVRHPEARLSIIGYQPTHQIMNLACATIAVYPDVADIRQMVAEHQICVLPFISGTGIKNKCLEAAAMGKVIVASTQACNGLNLESPSPLVCVDKVEDWVEVISQLWCDNCVRRGFETAARYWVERAHSWSHSALRAINSVVGSIKHDD